MNILLTGATGFVGSHVLRTLVNSNNRVIILKRSTSDTWRIDNLISHSLVEYYDLDKDPLEYVFNDNNNIDVIIHLATLYKKVHSASDVSPIVQSNIIFPMMLLDLACVYNVPYFINTDTFFETGLYARTKKLFLDMLQETVHENKIKAVNLKLYSPFGPKDNTTKAIPFIMNSFLSGTADKSIVKFGGERFFFTPVDFVARWYNTVVSDLSQVKDYISCDVHTGESYSIYDVYDMVERIHSGLYGFVRDNSDLPIVLQGLINTYKYYRWKKFEDI